MTKRILLFIFIILQPTASIAHLDEPKALIVVLQTQKNRITHFTKKGDNTNLRVVRNDAHEVMQAMRNDFTDHFDLCPVYYVMDTNLHLVKEKKFDGILLDNTLAPVRSAVIKPDELYFVAYFGKPSTVITSKDGTNTYSAKNDVGEGLVVVGPDLLPLKKYPGFIFVPDPSKSPAITAPRYNYDSPKFNISYRGWAKQLQQKLARKIERKNRKFNSWR